MYSHQKGCLPSIISSIAALIFIYFSLSMVFSVYFTWVDYRDALTAEEFTQKLLFVMLEYIILFIVFLPIIFILGGLFPAIRLTKYGVKYRYFSVFGGLINWSEIDDVFELKRPQNSFAIIISRKGFFLLNGLWRNVVYGLLFTGQLEPIMILSKGLENREKLISEIKEYIN